MKIACFHILYILLYTFLYERPKCFLMSFNRLFMETITPEIRKVFFQNYMINVVKIDEIRDELSTCLLVTSC